jgi:hypothetical protein
LERLIGHVLGKKRSSGPEPCLPTCACAFRQIKPRARLEQLWRQVMYVQLNNWFPVHDPMQTDQIEQDLDINMFDR